MLGDGLDVEIECGCCLGSPCVVKRDVFKALQGFCE